jgi:hypothetical protein
VELASNKAEAGSIMLFIGTSNKCDFGECSFFALNTVPLYVCLSSNAFLYALSINAVRNPTFFSFVVLWELTRRVDVLTPTWRRMPGMNTRTSLASFAANKKLGVSYAGLLKHQLR